MTINVTKPFLPPLEEFLPYLEQIWKSGTLTNDGPFLQQFEQDLSDYLHVPFVTAVVNGTMALEISIRCLGLSGEVITTPYTFVATSQALLSRGINPVFADIEPVSCTIDPDEIEKCITKKTTGILPVHIYGYPCKVEHIKNIAVKFNLKVIYDAAHAFGVVYKGKSIAAWGDLSILSFHATKTFNTFEGGAIICHEPETKKKLDAYRNFGYHKGKVTQQGINAKMNEFQAALGIIQLKYARQNTEKLRKNYSLYAGTVINIPGLGFHKPDDETEWNYSYFPVYIDEADYGCSSDELMKKLAEQGIFCRKYFNPLVTSFVPFSNFRTPAVRIAQRRSSEVLCLPMYPDLTEDEIAKVLSLLQRK
jgi:dTDP-4-amino-4,6-dideoxygalactose transaminase